MCCAAGFFSVFYESHFKKPYNIIIQWKKEQRGLNIYENLFSYPLLGKRGGRAGRLVGAGDGQVRLS